MYMALRNQMGSKRFVICEGFLAGVTIRFLYSHRCFCSNQLFFMYKHIFRYWQ
ncbi:unnamed protein product [Schistosoma curassoni]|uniref:Uncharacterized protein n=1 Tax=Schistosoma curassoni TaxID=6186 RepID=A0A183KQ21_9TREM|nr:unnamed protein product [Schistosoma curassoni]